MCAPLVGSGPTFIRNSQDFIDKVRHLTVDDDEIMVSFDVVSLFTCVPVALAVSACKAALQADEKLGERTVFEVQDLARLLDFCLKNTYFIFRGVIYKQLHGAPMGASISVTAANLAMESVESRALASFEPPPKVFFRYVDDCFCIIKRNALAAFTDHLNSIEEAIKFTVEEESSGRLPFLDVLVQRDRQRLSFKVHRKDTHSGRYLHFASVNPVSHKRSVAFSLIKRAQRICSKPEDLDSDLACIRRELGACKYPRSFIASSEKRALRPTEPRDSLSQRRASIPYVPGISEALARVLRGYNVQVAHIPSHKLRHELVSVKDKLKKEKFPGVVYKIPCADCNYVYVGESGNFERRLKEHMNDVKKKKVISSALAEHAEKTHHGFDWDQASVIAREKNWMKRHYLESLTIQTTGNTLNRNDGNLPLAYARCLKRLF